jgi:Uma2 family endonuclease
LLGAANEVKTIMKAFEYPLAMTREEFESWAPTIAEPWEWRLGYAIPVPRAFAGGTWAHAVLASTLLAKLSVGLKPPCRAVIGDLIRVATPTSQRYGDLYVVCGAIDATATVVTVPSVIIEVVSRESVERDLFEKRDEYLAIPGLEVYVAFFEEERRCLEFVPGREPVEQREFVTIHGVTIDLSELFADFPER